MAHTHTHTRAHTHRYAHMCTHTFSTHRFGNIPYFKFEKLTMVPIQTRMIDTQLLSVSEIAWLDAYHAQVGVL